MSIKYKVLVGVLLGATVKAGAADAGNNGRLRSFSSMSSGASPKSFVDMKALLPWVKDTLFGCEDHDWMVQRVANLTKDPDDLKKCQKLAMDLASSDTRWQGFAGEDEKTEEVDFGEFVDLIKKRGLSHSKAVDEGYRICYKPTMNRASAVRIVDAHISRGKK